MTSGVLKFLAVGSCILCYRIAVCVSMRPLELNRRREAISLKHMSKTVTSESNSAHKKVLLVTDLADLSQINLRKKR